MRVLVIPEDFRNDQYILQPLFKRLFRSAGMRAARVEICRDPLLEGVNQALRVERLREIVDQYPMIDVFILCVDRDGETNRRQVLDQIECAFGSRLVAVNAWEEIETWVLAGVDLPNSWRWADVRAEVNVKERYFEKLVDQRGLKDELGRGRRVLGDEASRNIAAIRQKCVEDFDELADRLANVR